MEKIAECHICHESYDQEDHRSVVLHPCGHIFGRACILDYFCKISAKFFSKKFQNRTTAPCPLCKKTFDKTQIGPLFISTTVIQPTGILNKEDVEEYKEEILSLQDLISEMNKEKDAYEATILKQLGSIGDTEAKINGYKSHTQNLAGALYQTQMVQKELLRQKTELAMMTEKQKEEIEKLKNSGRTLANTLLKFNNIPLF